MDNFSTQILDWFDHFGRKNLPWQKNISAYSVWISEIMLQQTQVATVIPYFENFLQSYPNIHVLAKAPLDSVLHLWTGLGYYARARNIHKSANIVTEVFGGVFPSDLETLIGLPGIGRSTAGAILSIAFEKATPILDGNVKRVLSRYHAVSGSPADKNVEKTLWSFAKEHTPLQRCAEYTQAIMDLGATVCTRTKPNCNSCPLKTSCQAYKENRVLEFPQQKKKKFMPVKTTNFLIIRNHQGLIMLEKRPLIGLWGGLWGFPEYQNENVLEYCMNKFGLKANSWTRGDAFRHTFSHFHLDITPIFISTQRKRLQVMGADLLWCLPTDLPKVGLAAPVKYLLEINHNDNKG